MSTPIWDEGKVAACWCATKCDRCDARRRCVQLCTVAFGEPWHTINLCVECWIQLIDDVATTVDVVSREQG